MSNKKFNLLTKTKFKAQTIGVKFILVLIGAIAVFSVIAPYIHIFLDKKDTVKVFGFRNLRSFLYVIGLPITLFFSSSFLFYISQFIIDKNIKKYSRTFGLLVLWSSFFQFIWIFWDRQDLPRNLYYLSILVLSAASALMYSFALIKRRDTIIKLRTIINHLSRFTIKDAKKFVREDKKEEYNQGYFNALSKGMKDE